MKGRYLLPGADEVLVNRIFLIGQKKLKLVLMKEYILMRAFFINELHIFECYARSQLIGRFIIVAEGQLTEKERLIGQQGASFLAIKLWDHYETLQKTVERFWKEIKNGEIKSGEVIAEKLANLGFVQQKAYNLILFSKFLIIMIM